MEWWNGYWEQHVVAIDLSRSLVREATPDAPPQQPPRQRRGLVGRALVWLGAQLASIGLHL
ncbi:MAG: hypothetical protein QME94_06065 [Anaerolineae bacterium]|nr:hypothetical protein [Anaerolineae bacterium]